MNIGPGTFRLILALIVVGYHLSRHIFIGNAAVFAFFILSGYWVSKMYEGKYEPMKRGIQIYLISRCWRIFPVYWLALVCAAGLNYGLEGSRYWDKIATYGIAEQMHFGLSNVFLLGYCQTAPKWLSPAWSLDIEMQFYLLLPLLLYACRYVNVRWCLFLSLAIMLWSLWHYGFLYKITFKYIPYFLIGIAMAKGIRFNFVKPKISLYLLVLILGGHFAIPILYSETVLGKFSFYNTHLNYVLPLIILPYIQHNINIKSIGNDKVYGALSYIVYLFHWVLFVPYLHYFGNVSPLQRIPYMLAYLALTLSLSLLVYFFFDRKNEVRRKQWVNSKFQAPKF